MPIPKPVTVMGTGDQVSGLGGAETLRWGWSPDGEVAAAVSRRQEWVLRLEERQEKWVIPDHGGIEWWAREAGLDPESGRNPLDV